VQIAGLSLQKLNKTGVPGNPFVQRTIDLKSYWVGKTNGQWHLTRKHDIKKTLDLSHLLHTHNALDDAKEQAAIFAKMLEYNPDQ
jgi:hypothetical protein